MLKAATPFVGTAVSVPERPVPPTRASVIGLVAVVTGLPLLSSTATWTAGEVVLPTGALVGCCTNASIVAVGGRLMVRVDAATALWDPSSIAMACTVEETETEKGC